MITRYITSLFFAVATILVAIVGYQSVWHHSPPLVLDAQNVTVKRDTAGVILRWNCHSRVLRDFKGHVIRSIIKEGENEIIQLPTNEFNLIAGDTAPMVKQFVLPGTLSEGRWCLESIMHWYEPLSLRESTMRGVSACFDVPPPSVLTDAEMLRKIDELEQYVRDHVRADFDQHADIIKGK